MKQTIAPAVVVCFLVLAFGFEVVASPRSRGRIQPSVSAWDQPFGATAEDRGDVFQRLRGTPPAGPALLPKPLENLDERQLVLCLTQHAWGYFRDLVDKETHLPLDRIDLSPTPRAAPRTSMTNIAMYITSTVGAMDLGIISAQEGRQRLEDVLQALVRLPQWRGLPYEWVRTDTLEPEEPKIVSAVSCGWLACALIVAEKVLDGEAQVRCRTLFANMDFRALYDAEKGLLFGHYNATQNKLSDYHNGVVMSETRIASVIAIGKGDVPPQHWFRMFRVLPAHQKNTAGKMHHYQGVPVFEGCFEFAGIRLVPSWGGSLFEFTMPSLFVAERQWAPHSFGENGRRAVLAQRAWAQEKGYPVWGFSPCATPSGMGYDVFGVPALGMNGYPEKGVVTPHASFLALEYSPAAAVENLKNLIQRFEMMGPYGPYDAVEVRSGAVARTYLALDVGMSIIAATNFLRDGAIQKRFHQDAVAKRLEPLLREERFEF